MKKITFSIIALALAASSWGQTLDRSIRPKAGPAPAVKMGKTESFTLPNGLRVFVVENHKLPTVSFAMEFDIKPGLEGDMTGFHTVVGELLTSGTKTRTKDKFDEEVDFIGANITATDNGINASGLKKHLVKLLDLYSDVAQNASFQQSELDKIKTRTKSGLETTKNEPDAMLKNVTAVLNYGKNHPYGEVPTEKTVDAISLDRCKSYYETYFRPNVAYLAIVGDVTVKEVKPLIEKYFAKWQKSDVPVATYPMPQRPSQTTVAFVPREAAVQSVVNVTYPIDLKIGTADVIKAKVANTILGGGSQGRLFLNLREKHAWTYGSYSSLDPDELVGSFVGYAKCRNAVTDSSITELLAEIKRMSNEKIDNEALQNTIAYLSGGFAIGLESPERVAQYAINIERYKMPKDYYENYLKNLAAVTPEDVQEVSRKYITSANANIIVVGNKEEVADKLKKFSTDGKINFYDNYGNELKVSDAKAVPAGMNADEVMKKNILALGGEKAIAAIKDMKIVNEGEFQGTKLSITQVRKAPNQLKLVVSAMGMTLQKVVLNGNKGYQEAQGQKQDLTAEELAEYKAEADIQSDLHPAQYGIKRTLKGMGQVNGSDAYIIEAVDGNGKKTTEFYDAQSFLLVKNIKIEATPKGEMSMETEMGDYREVPGGKGYKVPYTVKIPLGPGMSITTKVQSVEINKNIPASEFE